MTTARVFVFAVALLSLAILLADRRAEATPGATCFSDANCGYGEICVKDQPWSPSGVCVHGSR